MNIARFRVYSQGQVRAESLLLTAYLHPQNACASPRERLCGELFFSISSSIFVLVFQLGSRFGKLFFLFWKLHEYYNNSVKKYINLAKLFYVVINTKLFTKLQKVSVETWFKTSRKKIFQKRYILMVASTLRSSDF